MKPVSRAVADAFDRFWKAYPYRAENPKSPARIVFARLVAEGEDAEALIAAAGRYARFAKAEGIKSVFIPHARKWLNQRYFEDYMEADVPASAPEGPSPEHPLAFLYPEVGPGAWASYFAPLTWTMDGETHVFTARTKFALERLRRDWGRRIVTDLGPVQWLVAGEAS